MFIIFFPSWKHLGNCCRVHRIQVHDRGREIHHRLVTHTHIYDMFACLIDDLVQVMDVDPTKILQVFPDISISDVDILEFAGAVLLVAHTYFEFAGAVLLVAHTYLVSPFLSLTFVVLFRKKDASCPTLNCNPHFCILAFCATTTSVLPTFVTCTIDHVLLSRVGTWYSMALVSAHRTSRDGSPKYYVHLNTMTLGLRISVRKVPIVHLVTDFRGNSTVLSTVMRAGILRTF